MGKHAVLCCGRVASLFRRAAEPSLLIFPVPCKQTERAPGGMRSTALAGCPRSMQLETCSPVPSGAEVPLAPHQHGPPAGRAALLCPAHRGAPGCRGEQGDGAVCSPALAVQNPTEPFPEVQGTPPAARWQCRRSSPDPLASPSPAEDWKGEMCFQLIGLSWWDKGTRGAVMALHTDNLRAAVVPTPAEVEST